MPQKVIAEALEEVLDKQLVKAVGVCNYETNQLNELQGLLDKKNIQLASNQACQILHSYMNPHQFRYSNSQAFYTCNLSVLYSRKSGSLYLM